MKEGSSMGFFSKAFKQESTYKKKRLVDLVKKVHKTNLILRDIYSDLGTFVEDGRVLNGSPILLMGYSYTRRSIVQFMYIQGQASFEDIKYNNDLFRAAQQKTTTEKKFKTTEETVAFQNEASFQAIELLQSYDKRYNLELFRKIGYLIQNSSKYEYIIEEIIDSIDSEDISISHTNCIDIINMRIV